MSQGPLSLFHNREWTDWECWTGLINFWHLYNYPQHSQYIGLIINFYSQHLHSATPNIYCVSASSSTFTFDTCPELPPGFFVARPLSSTFTFDTCMKLPHEFSVPWPPQWLLLLTPAPSWPHHSLCSCTLMNFTCWTSSFPVLRHPHQRLTPAVS